MTASIVDFCRSLIRFAAGLLGLPTLSSLCLGCLKDNSYIMDGSPVPCQDDVLRSIQTVCAKLLRARSEEDEIMCRVQRALSVSSANGSRPSSSSKRSSSQKSTPAQSLHSPLVDPLIVWTKRKHVDPPQAIDTVANLEKENESLRLRVQELEELLSKSQLREERLTESIRAYQQKRSSYGTQEPLPRRLPASQRKTTPAPLHRQKTPTRQPNAVERSDIMLHDSTKKLLHAAEVQLMRYEPSTSATWSLSTTSSRSSTGTLT